MPSEPGSNLAAEVADVAEGTDESPAPIPAPPVADGTFRWLGVAGIELRLDGRVLAVDPFFTRCEPWRVVARVEPDRPLIGRALPTCDYVLVSHAHWDHMMDVPEVVRVTGALALGSPNTCRLLGACGVAPDRIRPIAPGDRLALGPFTVDVLPAEHLTFLGRPPLRGGLPRRLRPPLRPYQYRMDADYSFLIEAAGLRILDWTSAGADGAPEADVLCMQPYLAPRQCAQLLEAVRPRVVVPVHWDDFTRPLSRPQRPVLDPRALRRGRLLQRVDLAEFQRSVQATLPRATVLLPEILEAYPLAGWQT